MGKKSLNTKSEEKIESPLSLERRMQKRKSTLKKSASQLEILCGAQVCCVLVGPTGNVEVWPENHAEAVSIITKYKQCNKKTKLRGKVNRSKSMGQLEENKGLAMDQVKRSKSMGELEENKGLAVVHVDSDQSLNSLERNFEKDMGFEENEGLAVGHVGSEQSLFTLETFEEDMGFEENEGLAMGYVEREQSLDSLENFEKKMGFDVHQFLNNLMEDDDLEDHDKCFDMGDDDIERFFMTDFTMPNTDFDQQGFSFGNEELDNLCGESSKHMSDFLGSNIETIDQGTASVEGDDHNQQKLENHVLNSGSNSVEVDGNDLHRDHDFDQYLNDVSGDPNDLKEGFLECSTSNAYMSTAPGFEHHQIDNVWGMWPCETLWPSPQYSGLKGANYWPDYSTKFGNENNNINSPFLLSLDELQPKLMGSNKLLQDIGEN